MGPPRPLPPFRRNRAGPGEEEAMASADPEGEEEEETLRSWKSPLPWETSPRDPCPKGIRRLFVARQSLRSRHRLGHGIKRPSVYLLARPRSGRGCGMPSVPPTGRLSSSGTEQWGKEQ